MITLFFMELMKSKTIVLANMKRKRSSKKKKKIPMSCSPTKEDTPINPQGFHKTTLGLDLQEDTLAPETIKGVVTNVDQTETLVTNSRTQTGGNNNSSKSMVCFNCLRDQVHVSANVSLSGASYSQRISQNLKIWREVKEADPDDRV